MPWKNLNKPNFKNLENARLQLHQAVQLISASGISFIEHQDDDSHTNMQWLPDSCLFGGSSFGDKKWRLTIDFSSMGYLLLDQNLETVSSFLLPGKTQQQAINWFISELKKGGFDTSSFTMEKHYEIPENEQAKGAIYSLIDNGKPYDQLNNQFSNAYAALQEIADKYDDSSTGRLWPHHFDLGLLLNVEQGSSSEDSKTISLGFSAGDEHYNQPYYYVSPWPYPNKEILLNYSLSFGYWHTENFIAAVLPAEKYADKENQQAITLNYLRDAISACKNILKKIK